MTEQILIVKEEFDIYLCPKMWYHLQEFSHSHQPHHDPCRRAAADVRVAVHPEEVGRETREDHALRPGNVLEAKWENDKLIIHVDGYRFSVHIY